ncbi:MAG TPA: hypothetical protein VFW23_12500 [Tepidisphaeraceae bacterium]|nr:hypothetical protein [Tepidisphaeraceae bacterium]
MPRERPASKMTNAQLHAELRRVSDEWDEFREGLEGMSGSPGEWMVERMDEIATEIERRKKNA